MKTAEKQARRDRREAVARKARMRSRAEAKRAAEQIREATSHEPRGRVVTGTEPLYSATIGTLNHLSSVDVTLDAEILAEYVRDCVLHVCGYPRPLQQKLEREVRREGFLAGSPGGFSSRAWVLRRRGEDYEIYIGSRDGQGTTFLVRPQDEWVVERMLDRVKYAPEEDE